MTSQIYGLLAEFETEEDLFFATRQMCQKGYRCLDAYSPYPIDGLDEILEFRSHISWLVFIGGLLGAFLGYGLQYDASVISYPVMIAGRPFHSWPSFIPVTFEFTVLCAALTATFAVIFGNRLPQPYHPVFFGTHFHRASQDRFFLCIQARDPLFHLISTQESLAELHPLSLEVLPSEKEVP